MGGERRVCGSDSQVVSVVDKSSDRSEQQIV